tara:strand:- start:227 stop:1177 length:951 start_codon:yes stop_codon:yes gene_type:complete
MHDLLKTLIKQFMPYAQEKMGFKDPPKLFLRQDTKNATNPLGKTAFYDPQAKSVTIYTTNRHPKDVMRSLSHELVHHKQNCNGQFEDVGEMGEGYAQNNAHLRGMEREAYELGNMCFRDWEDSIKGTIYNEHLLKGVNNTMSTKIWKNKELTTLLSEAWGFGFNLDRLNEECAPCGDGDVVEEAEEEVVEEAEEEVVEEAEEEITEMCPDAPHGAEMMAMDDGEEGEPEDPSAIVDELSDLLTRLQAALGGDEEPIDEPMEEITGREDPASDKGREPARVSPDRKKPMQEAQIRQLIRKSLKSIIEKKQAKKRTKK